MKTPEQMAEEYVEVEFKGNGGNVSRAVCKHDFMSGYKAAIDLIHSKTTKEMSDLANAFAANYFGKEYAVSFDSFLAGYQAAKELYAAKLKEANDTVAGMADECEGLKTIIYDNEETNLLTPAKWISVKERLPNVEKTSRSLRRESSCVLIVSYDNVYVAHLCEDWSNRSLFIFEACNCNCRAFDMEVDEWKLDQVTHWQPLPEPPKEEK